MSARRFVLPAVLTIALIAAALMLRGKGRLPDTPEDAVKAFFLACQEGDSSACLALLSGRLKGSFEETQRQLGTAGFRDSLRSSVAGLKGFAVSRTGESTDDRATLEVELVFADRGERQRFELVREPRGWSIASVDRAEVEKSAQPYGAPVFDIAPGGDANTNPIPADSAQSPKQ